jgi:glycerophosphoryl diester phosphodiesterase
MRLAIMSRVSPRVPTPLSPAVRPPQPLVFAHRGGRALGPENTITAFDLGLAAGADGLELDVHLSRDGRIAVIHDERLDRTTDRVGAVADCTSEDLARLNAARRYGVELEHDWAAAPEGVPTLDTVLARYAVPIIIEMKADRRALAAAVVAAVRAASAERRVCLGSFATSVLEEARRLAPEIPTSAGRDEVRRALRWSTLGLGIGWRVRYHAFQLPERVGSTTVVTPRFIRASHRSGRPVQIWTVNEESDMLRLLEWGADGLITDHPAAAVRVRDAWVRSHPIRA